MSKGPSISRFINDIDADRERCEDALRRIALLCSGMTEGLVMSPYQVAICVKLALEEARGEKRVDGQRGGD